MSLYIFLHFSSNATALMLYRMKASYASSMMGDPEHLFQSKPPYWYSSRLSNSIIPCTILESSIPSICQLKPLILLLPSFPSPRTPSCLYRLHLFLHLQFPLRIIHSALSQANANEQRRAVELPRQPSIGPLLRILLLQPNDFRNVCIAQMMVRNFRLCSYGWW